MSARTLSFRRLLAAPGREAAVRDAVVEVQGGRVRSVAGGAAGADTGAAEDLLAMPAMVNAHDHGYGLRPLALGGADDALECWIASLTGRPSIDAELEAAVAFGRMALSGIGATVHCHNSLAAERLADEAAGGARAAADVGLRVAFSCPILDRNAFAYGDQRALLPDLDPVDRTRLTAAMARTGPASHLVDQVEGIAAAFESERFRVQYGPIGPQWCEDATLERIARASADHDRRIHMHLLESPRQREWLDFAYPRGIVRHLDDIGFLSPRLTVAHGVQLTEAECALLAEREVTVAVNTSSNLRLRSGVAPVARFIEHGLRFGLGLDGGAHDDDQDYFRDLRLAWRLHNGTGLAPAFPPARLFDAALRDGARVIDGAQDYGTIRAGARADLVALDYAAMGADLLVDNNDEMDVLLTRATAEDIRHLIVDGRDVVRDGRLASLDLGEMEAELMARARSEAPIPPEQPARDRRRREAVRRYYAANRHLSKYSGPRGGK
ncbi:MAG: amidohydrolase family protein [Immundisolibacterales bacterium]|nr:amidohydrolase family protein [Immundisolibacterales bacterium]